MNEKPSVCVPDRIRREQRVVMRVARGSSQARSLDRRRIGYGSRWLIRASMCAYGLRYLRGHSIARVPVSLMHLPYLVIFLCVVPRVTLSPSESPAGECIRRHLRMRRWGMPRFRLAQGVLHLPGDYATYLRGRQRQAVRTNLSRARENGVRCVRIAVPRWTPPEHGHAAGAPVERWQAINRAGLVVGDAWVTVDDECALLHSLISSEQNVRWVLHSAIVEHLCASGCRHLLTNSHDAFLMPPGQQYFQRLLGYSIGRLSVSSKRRRSGALASQASHRHMGALTREPAEGVA
jgi:hypothetical protein